MSALKLNVESLNVRFVNGKKVMHAVRDVSFTLGREKLAIVGESGSGKSTVGRSLLKLHPGSAQITAKACSSAMSTCSVPAKRPCRKSAASVFR